MRVKINKDEKTATDENGKLYTIKGLIIKKPDQKREVLYEHGTPMCNAVIFRGLHSQAIDIGNNEIHLL